MNSLGVLASMAVLLVVVTLLLSRPWWPRSKSDGRPLRAAANVAVYRQRLLEIDADEAAGLLDEATARQLRDEHAARLLQDADDVAPGVTPVQTGRTWALLILLPIFAVGAYAASGRWPMAEKIEQARVDPDVASELALEHGLEQLVQHLEAQPDDAEAWARLGEIELSRGRSDAAASAYAKATALVPDRGDWWAAEGEALAMAQSQDLRGAPAGRFERALVLSPDNSKALFYGGMVAAQSGDFALASQRWRRLKQQGGLPEGLANFIDSSLAQWDQPVVAPGQSPGQGPSTAENQTAPGVLSVTLATASDRGAPPSVLDTLTVFARPVGGRMPIAVRRQVVGPDAFPLTVMLSDADAMTPDALLSEAGTFELVARLSRGEGVAAQPEDWEGQITVDDDTDRSSLQLRLAPRQLP